MSEQQMEKMREEYEAWYSEQFAYSDKKLTNHGDTYLSPFVAGLWMAWKASRAALCVELPEAPVVNGREDFVDYLDRFRVALDEIGVEYK